MISQKKFAVLIGRMRTVKNFPFVCIINHPYFQTNPMKGNEWLRGQEVCCNKNFFVVKKRILLKPQ
jgi:hypothetical protein